ncbi:MAG TPA: hypothetical protein ENN67_05830, partial [Firmicutes bacterium]|nr:hypothetical protein [Bacillota bacterium]
MISYMNENCFGKAFFIFAILVLALNMIIGCSGGDPLGVTDGITQRNSLDELTGSKNPQSGSDRIVWGIYLLDIRPEEGYAGLVGQGRDLAGHFDVTKFVTKPECDNCVKFENFSFDKSAGILDLDAILVNPNVVGGYDVRGVVLLDEWNTGRRLESAHGLTDLWSGDPYRPAPFINYARDVDDRFFGPGEEHSAHVTIYFPTPRNFIVPYIVDACYPGHSEEPVEMMDIEVEGSVHPTGYDLKISMNILDWQDNIDGVYVDCSPLNFVAGLHKFEPPVGTASDGDESKWTIHLQYDATNPNGWLPNTLGEVELPLVAIDSVADSHLFQRIKIEVTEDTEPPQWTGAVGINEVWWGGNRAIVSFYPATDPSGPVKYNIYHTTDIPLIEPGKNTIVGWSHYSVETVNVAVYQFIVRAEDQAGNEDDN